MERDRIDGIDGIRDLLFFMLFAESRFGSLTAAR